MGRMVEGGNKIKENRDSKGRDDSSNSGKVLKEKENKIKGDQ